MRRAGSSLICERQSERVGKSSEPILEWENDDPVARLIKTIRLPQKTSINFYKP